ncbi:hypothetical protein DM02DRAFT_608956, partial [Periconia macrospinosa]
MSYGGGYGGGRNGGGGYSNGYDTTSGGYGAYNYDYTGQYATYGYEDTSPWYRHRRLSFQRPYLYISFLTPFCAQDGYNANDGPGECHGPLSPLPCLCAETLPGTSVDISA